MEKKVENESPEVRISPKVGKIGLVWRVVMVELVIVVGEVL